MWNREHGYRRGERELQRGEERSRQAYDRGYEGGSRRSSGFPHDRVGYDRSSFRGGPGGPGDPRGRGYGGDYWWIGEHELRRRGIGYDAGYRPGAEDWHPGFSPVGGMHPAVGGWYLTHRLPRPLRENVRFSDWTRWF